MWIPTLCATLAFVLNYLAVPEVVADNGRFSVPLADAARLANCTGDGTASEEVNIEAFNCLLKELYEDSTGLYYIESLGREGTYGEITPKGVVDILQAVSDSGSPVGLEDRFYDLGSGFGKLVLQMRLTTPIGRSAGIELSKDRHELAVRSFGRVQTLLAKEGRWAFTEDQLQLMNGNILDFGKWADATVIYMASLCFPKELMLQLSTAMAKELQPGTLIFSINDLPGCHPGLLKVKSFRTEMSWNKGTINMFVKVPPLPHPEVAWFGPPTARWEALVDAEIALAVGGPPGEGIDNMDQQKQWMAHGMDRWEGAAKALIQRYIQISMQLAGEKASVTEAINRSLRHNFEGGTSSVQCTWKELKDTWVIDPSHMQFILSGTDTGSADQQGMTLLILAAQDARGEEDYAMEAAIKFVKNGVALDLQDRLGRTALHYGCRSGSTRLVQLLLSNGAATNVKDNLMNTPLHVAANKCHKEVAELLVNAGAPLQSHDTIARTPLHVAVKDGCVPVAQLLLRSGADSKAVDIVGNTPADLARSVRMLDVFDNLEATASATQEL